MERNDAIQEIRTRWRDLLTMITQPARQRVNGEMSYICPFCGHGAHGDGLTFDPTSKDKNTLHCFGCNFTGDIIDVFKRYNQWDFNTTIATLADWIQITIDKTVPFNGISDKNTRRDKDIASDEKTAQNGNMEEPAPPDFTDYYFECLERLSDPRAVAYLSKRGISRETAEYFCLGFDPQADPSGQGYPAPRIIIPTSTSHYIGRAINDSILFPKINPKGCKAGIFNDVALNTEGVEYVFVTEGAFDAMSLHEIGQTAIALNSTSNADKFIDLLKQHPTKATLIVALDSDGAGNTATAKFVEKLQNLDSVFFITADINGQYKDPSEHLQYDRAGFTDAVKRAIRQADPRPDNSSIYVDDQMDIDSEPYKLKIPTGFSNLDEYSGGLRPGLYVLAAISSLGKTSFAHQIAENIATAGRDVLFFSMEQSRLELTAKSLRRILSKGNKDHPVTTLSIMEGNRPPEVIQAKKVYQANTGGRLSIIEGNFDCDLAFISRYITRYIKRNNVIPVVFIDYLQIVQPDVDKLGRRQTVKETVDLTTTELKRLSRSKGIPIVAISSVNRANYTVPIDFESLKESGNIEFSADVIWGMQLHCLNEKLFFESEKKIVQKRNRVKQAKAENPRKIDLVCLKNRFGKSNFICTFKYYPGAEIFETWQKSLAEVMEDIHAQDEKKKAKRRSVTTEVIKAIDAESGKSESSFDDLAGSSDGDQATPF